MEKSTKLALVIATLLACNFGRDVAAEEQGGPQRSEDEIEVALKCFRTLPEGLRLVLKGPTIRIWVERATIPGTSGGLTGPDAHQVLIVTGPKSAQLRSFSVSGGRITILQELYLLQYSEKTKEWKVAEGNGGIATYEAVSRYVNSMQKRLAERTIETEALKGKGRCKIK
jgi:hypothetical protein